jgi:hypothetical protein
MANTPNRLSTTTVGSGSGTMARLHSPDSTPATWSARCVSSPPLPGLGLICSLHHGLSPDGKIVGSLSEAAKKDAIQALLSAKGHIRGFLSAIGRTGRGRGHKDPAGAPRLPGKDQLRDSGQLPSESGGGGCGWNYTLPFNIQSWSQINIKIYPDFAKEEQVKPGKRLILME